ncbi:MAG: PAS domain S-box protein [Candidatus Omnitrophica bacterium]|nr:PAS domain S-box protein [Candidatus Omnitrophota bacterium]MCF7895040.1 PAS domain S-box protein [Candidatus Omnitrophota bacterium]
MKTIKRIIPIMSIVLLGGIILFSLVFYSYQELQVITKKLVLSRKIVESSFNLNYLTGNYLLKPTKRMKIQWDISYATFKQQINQLKKENLSPEEIKIVKKIIREFNSAKYYFLSLKFLEGSQDKQHRVDPEYKNSGELISLNLHQMASLVLYLESVFRKQFVVVQKKFTFWFLISIAVLFSIFSWFVYRLFEDIRYRDKTQKRLKETNQKLRIIERLVEFTGDGVYRYRYKDGKILFANQGLINILELNCSPDEVIGKKIDDLLFYLEKPGKVRSLIDKKGSIRDYPYHFKTLAEKEKWVLHNSFLIKEDGDEKVVESIVTDVTEQRKAEQRNKFLAGMLDSAPLSVIATDQGRKIVYVNPATEKLYGYSSKELLGKDPLLLNVESNAEEIEDNILNEVQKGKTFIKRLKNQKKNGEVFIAESAIYQLKDKEGNFVALVGFQKDITEEISYHQRTKRSEVKFRTIFQKAGTAIFVADPTTGIILDCNQRAEELMQISRKDLVGMHQTKLHPQKGNNYRKIFKQHVKKRTNADYEGHIQDSQGIIKPVWISAELLNFGSKNLMVGFFTDLSLRFEYEKKEKEALKASVKAKSEHAKAKELSRAYGELKKIQEKLIQTEKLAALGKLSGIVAHDLRNPLGVIRNSIYILKKKLSDSSDSKIKRYLKILDEEIVTADTIIEDVLSFTRLKNIKLLTIDLNKEIKRAIGKINIPGNIKLITKIDENIPKIKGDKDQLQRVFINLFNNAVEAMPEGGKLTISIKREDNFVHIIISDTGAGIKEKDKIFEPMYSTKVHGSGLGLSACKNIVTAHRGQIEVRSKEDKGTTMLVKLPLG